MRFGFTLKLKRGYDQCGGLMAGFAMVPKEGHCLPLGFTFDRTNFDNELPRLIQVIRSPESLLHDSRAEISTSSDFYEVCSTPLVRHSCRGRFAGCSG
jgi:hypothetical protein